MIKGQIEMREPEVPFTSLGALSQTRSHSWKKRPRGLRFTDGVDARWSHTDGAYGDMLASTQSVQKQNADFATTAMRLLSTR